MEDKTHYAPSYRSTTEEILKEFELVGSQKFFTEIFGAMTGIAAVIDKNRQIVFANDDFLALLGISSLESILGKRPGEVISCLHSAEEPFGCGTALACTYCGAVNAILESQKSGVKAVKETRVTTSVEGVLKSWDLTVTSTPISLSGNIFYVLILQDISNEKRRFAIERIFFHDLLNSAGGLNGLLTLLKEGTDPEEMRELITLSEEASRDMIEEILIHRQIRAAEAGDLVVKPELVFSTDIINSSVSKIRFHEVAKNKEVVISENCENIEFDTDRILLQRVILNLLKNALEASDQAHPVTIGIENRGNLLRLWVKNEGVIPQDIQMQIFQRSFSTKGKGRGIGTYSIRLLTENYLKGKVSFISNETDGTVFSVELNKLWPVN